MVLPKITYGLDIWYTPPTKPIGYTKNTGLVGVLRNLQKAQRIATTAITGTLRSAPTDLLDTHAGLLPMELVLMKACHRAMMHMLTLPNSHPLHNTIVKAKRNPPDKLVLCRLRLRALSRPSQAVGSRGRHKPSLRPMMAHGSGFKYQKPEAAAQADGFL